MIEQKASAQQIAVTSTQIIVGVGAIMNGGASLLRMTSPIGIFSTINQYQLLQLLLISGAYISEGVSNLITGVIVSVINLDFIKIEKIWIIENINNYFLSEQSNENLSNIGINSGSTIVNLLKLFYTIILIVLLHLVFLRFYVKWKKYTKESKWRKIGERIFRLFTYSIYIRIILQSFIPILLPYSTLFSPP